MGLARPGELIFKLPDTAKPDNPQMHKAQK
jgi:hypothetical protein